MQRVIIISLYNTVKNYYKLDINFWYNSTSKFSFQGDRSVKFYNNSAVSIKGIILITDVKTVR